MVTHRNKQLKKFFFKFLFFTQGNNEKLKDLLRNPYLREYLVQIDQSPDAWKAMKIAMLEPLFIEFANECLTVVEPDL